MVLVNPTPNSVNADLHFVPSIHLPDTNRAAVKAAAATNATATISKGTIVTNAPAPFRATFSSQGPLLAGGGDILKPDIIAPGQDVLAAVAPPGNANRLFDVYSGTSMSSPHMAGLGALMKQAHPDWSPAAIKSAFMTTAYQANVGQTDGYTAFGWGAGHVDPNKAADPGLVFDNDFDDWLAFLEGQRPRDRSAASARRERPEPRLDRDRRSGRHADGQACGHERGLPVRDLLGLGAGSHGHHRGAFGELVYSGTGLDDELDGDLHADDGAAGHVPDRLHHVDR